MATFGGSGSTTGSGQSRFQRSPSRGVPSADRGRRTTAGSADIYKGRGAGLGGPNWTAVPAVLFELRKTITQLPPWAVRVLGEMVRDDIAYQGKRYKLRGRNGKKYPLEAEVQRNRAVLRDSAGSILRTQRGKAKLGRTSQATISVAGVPAGWWSIVTHGSTAHLITGTRGRRMTSKQATSRFLRSMGTTRAGESRGTGDDVFNDGSPIRLKPGSKGPGGWVAWAIVALL